MSKEQNKQPKPFPKEIYVVREQDGTEDEYLNAFEGERAEVALTTESRTRVATYRLVEVKEGKLEPVFSTIVG